MIQGHAADQDGRVFVTPECVSHTELEGQINALQDNLDLLRTRRASQGRIGRGYSCSDSARLVDVNELSCRCGLLHGVYHLQSI